MIPSPRETVLCRYHYDSLHRLTSHALADTPERQRFYCKSRLATEIQGAMRYSIVQQGDQLLAQQRSEGDAPDTTLLATDQQRSVLQTVKANQLPQPIAYSSYGHRPVRSGLLSLLGFNGERPDPVTGCYLLGNGHRAFNPILMRFNSPDSLSPFGEGGLNSYAYCHGDPINLSDPNGHAAILARIGKIPLSRTRPHTATQIKKPESFTPTKTNNTTTLQNTTPTPYKLYSTNEKNYPQNLRMEDYALIPPEVKARRTPIKMISNLDDLAPLSNRKLNFIFTPRKKLYISSGGHQYLSDLTGNPQLISAGEITMTGSNFFTIKNSSGHFIPDPDSLTPVKEHLESLGANVTTIEHFRKRN